MDIGSPVFTSVSDVNSSHDLKQLYLEPSQHNGGLMEDVSLNDLGSVLTEFLHIQDGRKLASNSILPQSSEKNETSLVEKKDECEEHKTNSTVLTSDKCLYKCATSPCFREKAASALSVNGEYEEVEDKEGNGVTAAIMKGSECESCKPADPLPISLPTPLKLVSAMKGSREKQGTQPKKLTVTWAPDVYDPPPSAPTTLRINRPWSKSHSKKKWKGKSSKGSSKKDKKQVRKHGVSSNKLYQSLDDNDKFDKVVICNEGSTELGDFDVGSPDSYCGSSFLKKSVTKLHFSIAEAL